MLRTLIAALCVALSTAPMAEAQDERKRLGYGRLITNDFFGDGEDRWRTGGFQSSRVWGPAWEGTAPSKFGQLIELRLAAEIIAPDDIRAFDPTDRPYAGVLSAGLHTHFQRGVVEYAMGGDIVFVGPQTQLDEFQDAFHDTFNIVRPSDAVRDAQLGNDIYPSVVLEAGRRFDMDGTMSIRPFVEARAGVETLVRAGFDVTYGGLGRDELLVRDSVSGQRYRAVEGDWTGTSVVFGADVAHVADSQLLPDDRGFVAEETRERVRAGVMWRSETGIAGFYGLTYLSEEFEGQNEGQVVGAIRLRIPF